MKKHLFITLGLFSALNLAQAALPEPAMQKAWRANDNKTDAAAKTFKPVLTGNVIQCGNKTVQWDAAGQIRISNGGGLLFFCNPHYVYMQDRKHVDWKSFTDRKCSVKIENGKVIWDLKKDLGGKTYDAATQTLEITPEGLLKVHVKINVIQAPGWVPRGKGASIFCELPVSRAEGKYMTFNGKRILMKSSVRNLCNDWKSKNFNFEFYTGNNADMIGLSTSKPGTFSVSAYPNKASKAFWAALTLYKNLECTFLLDIRKGIVQKFSPDTRAGINFKTIENLELPDSSRRNLLVNSSFERGLEGYHSPHAGQEYWKGLWEWTPFEVVKDSSAPFGKYVLRFNARQNPFPKDDFRQLEHGANIGTHSIVVPEGKYTISCYAKAAPGVRNAEIRIWVPNFHSGSRYTVPNKTFKKNLYLSSKWKRFSYSFYVPKGFPLQINMNALVRSQKEAYIYLDGLQLERGDKATEYEQIPAEGQLVTSDPDNFVSADQKINGKLVVTTAKANMSGKAEIRIRNFFGEELLKKQFSFKTGADKTSEIALPLDTLPGLGVFMLRADYTLADGTKAYEHHRYSKIKFLNNTHPNKIKFGFDYERPENHFHFYRRLDRWRKVGVGVKYHNFNRLPEIWETERKYGVEPMNNALLSYFRTPKTQRPRLDGFGILDLPKNGRNLKKDDPRFLVRDFYLDSNGTITPEYLQKLQNAVKTIVARYPHVPLWSLGGEIIAKFPPEWWSKEKTPEACARAHALLLKAFVAGVKEANPNAKVFQDDPCNMRPDGGIAETERLLTECNKLGVRFDMIGIHTYRYSPESPDLDSDTQTFLKMLDRVGYSNVPVFWPEGMHWGPFEIPQWGTQCSTWGGVPKTWRLQLLSYDMGATEKKSAAWYARSWLVALKYGDRIQGATAGNVENNCYMDLNMTPYASQLAPNVLGNVLGDARFKKDIRFAPCTRAYVFEDGKKRPVAAVWCHLDKVDEGYMDAPVVEADFGNSLESVIDFMNSPRKFNAGKYRFPVTSFPLFLRGKPGTLKQMIAALEGTNVISGQGVAPLEILANPQSMNSVKINIKNFLSRPFKGTLNGKRIDIPASGSTNLILPVKGMKANAVNKITLPVSIQSDSGAAYQYDLSFEAMSAKHVPDEATLQTIDWSKLPQLPLYVYKSKNSAAGGLFRVGWNRHGIFIEVAVKDKKFVHIEYEKPGNRWCNDSLQIYFDTMANARVRTFKGYDEDDYEYAVYPNSKGDAAITYRARTVEQQLGLATQAPKDGTFAPDIPATFTNKNGIQTYRVFFPAKYLLPIQLKPGWVLGFDLYVNNSDEPKKVNTSLSTSPDKDSCYKRPHLWPALLLTK